MPKTSFVLLTALLVAPACTSAPAEAPELRQAKAAAPAEAGFIESADVTGTGCDGSAVTAISPDKQASTTTFSAFVAAVDPAADPELASRNCLVMLNINVPAGWSYRLDHALHRGFAGLEKGVTASRQSLYLISGSPVLIPPAGQFKGETNDDYVQDDAPTPWSPCGGGQVLWIATQTEVKNDGHPQRAGQLTVDSIDTELQWRRCK
jgi:hypothetical protein